MEESLSHVFRPNMRSMFREVGRSDSPYDDMRDSEPQGGIQDILLIPLHLLTRDPERPFIEFDARGISRLAASLSFRGQLQPIRIRWHEPLKRFVVTSGERRLMAAKRAGLAGLSCVITRPRVGAFEGSVVELARAFARLMAVRLAADSAAVPERSLETLRKALEPATSD